MDSWSLGRRERYQRGTGSSNPSLSRGESCANLHAGGAGPDGGESDLAQGHSGKKAASAPERRLRLRSQLLQRGDTGARPRRLQNPLAANTVRRTSATRSLRWQPARRSRKSPLSARALAPTMSAPRFPGTSGRAASKTAMGNSTPYPNYCPTKFGPSWPIEKAALPHRSGPILLLRPERRRQFPMGVARVTDELKHSVIGIVKVSAQAFHACRQAFSTSTRNGWSST